MQKTTNFNLNKPEAGDPMRVSDFNENADKVDTALGALTAAVGTKEILFGGYIGTGIAETFIDLGCTPKLVILMGQFDGGVNIAIVTASFCYCVNHTGSHVNGTRIVEGGISIKNTLANLKDKQANYVLFL